MNALASHPRFNLVLHIIFVVFFSMTSHVNAALERDNLVGQVIDNKTGAPLYTETHRFSNEGDREVITSEFIRPSGEKMAERIIEMQGDKVQTYQFKQFNVDYQESALRNRDHVVISSVNNGEESNEVVFPKDPRNIVIDAGFKNFVTRNWDELLAGKTKKFDFISVNLGDSVRLKVKHERTENGIEYFKMNVANTLISMLIKPIQAGYYSDTRQLAYYNGMSNIKNDDGKRFKSIEITYQRTPTKHLSAN